MNRLCIYMTYHKENKIDPYIGKVLESLKACCSAIYLVCNTKRIDKGLSYVTPYVDEIFYRENIGYDAGAYQDALCRFLGWDVVWQYDELVLANDSFFGFFYPLQDTFALMAKEECDFWGMTGQAAGEYQNPLYRFDAHIHSYFLTFKESVFKSSIFRQFWEAFVCPETFREAIVGFEIGINVYLRNHGFRGKSYIDVYHLNLKRNENPCYTQLYQLVKDYKFPVMKKKSVRIRNEVFLNTMDTLSYLQKNTAYPTEEILFYLEKQFDTPGLGDESSNSLEVFYQRHSEIDIYGAGMCGKNLARYFAYKGWRFRHFLVTDPASVTENTIGVEDAVIHPDTGIIISVLREEIAKEMAMHIGERCRKEQLFFISDCEAIKLSE